MDLKKNNVPFFYLFFPVRDRLNDLFRLFRSLSCLASSRLSSPLPFPPTTLALRCVDDAAVKGYDYTTRSSASEGCRCDPTQKQMDDYQVRCKMCSQGCNDTHLHGDIIIQICFFYTKVLLLLCCCTVQ